MLSEKMKDTVADVLAMAILGLATLILIVVAYLSLVSLGNFLFERWENHQDKQDAYMQEVIKDPKKEIIVNY